MSYSLEAIFWSEFLGMTLTIFMGEAVLANELLQSTKGHGLGFLGVSVGFGLAFGISIAWFGYISAHLNPAMFFFLAIQGDLEQGWAQWAVGTVADFLGAFVGAFLVWLYFLPHFGAGLPLPPDDNAAADLLYGPATLMDNAGRLASAFGDYSRAPGEHDTGGGANGSTGPLSPDGGPVEQTTRRDRFTLRKLLGKDGMYDDDQREALLDKMEMIHDRRQFYKIVPLDPILSQATNRASVTALSGSMGTRSAGSASTTSKKDGIQRSNSINVATLAHEHDVDSSGVRPVPVASPSNDTNMADPLAERQLVRRHSAQIAALLHEHDKDIVDLTVDGDNPPTDGLNGTHATHPKKHHVTIEQNATTIPDGVKTTDGTGKHDEETGETAEAVTTTSAAKPSLSPQEQMELAKRRETYEAAIRADSAAKLSIFATRPAIYHRPYNFMQETLASAVLFFGAEMFSLGTEVQQEQSGNSLVITAGNDPLMNALMISLFIALIVMGLGGVTGVAINPARDIGPRFAHWILPFPNKGPSEWHYGLVVPLIAPYVGACIAAALNQAAIKLFASDETNTDREL